MAEKLMSISIAAYCVAGFLRNTLDSLIRAEDVLDRMEILIVNDGSIDETGAIAHEYEKRYPGTVFVLDKENGGYGSTINASLAAATGKYYKLLDGDDWFETENLSGYLKYLEKASADLVLTPYREVRQQVREIDTHAEIGEEPVPLARQTFSHDVFQMHELTVKTEVLRSAGTRITEKCFYTDIEFVFKAVKASKTISRCPLPVYCYRLGLEEQSVSLKGIRKHYPDYQTVLRTVFADYQASCSSDQGGKKQILDSIIRHFTFHTYHSFMLLEKPETRKKELMALDEEIRTRFPEAYRCGNGSKMVRGLRASGFVLYGLFCRIKGAGS